MTRPIQVSFLLASVMLAGSEANALATTYNLDFNNHDSLAALPYAPITFVFQPWYQVNGGSAAAPMIFTVQDNSGAGHFHLGFEDACINCVTTFNGSSSFGYNRNCIAHPGPSVPACIPIDTNYAGRTASGHDGYGSVLISAQGGTGH